MTKAESDVNKLFLHYTRDQIIDFINLTLVAIRGNTEEYEHWTEVKSIVEKVPNWYDRNAYVVEMVKGDWFYCSKACMLKDNGGDADGSTTVTTSDDRFKRYPKTKYKCDCCGKEILTVK